MRLKVVEHDATTLETDVLALKYAQARYGLDELVHRQLHAEGISEQSMSPAYGKYSVVSSIPAIAARKVLFVGTGPLDRFDYREVRLLARNTLLAIQKTLPLTKSFAMTLHGVNFGLDEAEALRATVAGLLDAVEEGTVPTEVEIIWLVEQDARRAKRLRELLITLLPNGHLDPPIRNFSSTEPQQALRSVGYDSSEKPHIFVAMPFSDDFDDVFHYGIQGAVRKTGLLCERADLAVFTGDIMTRVQERIRTATILIADLTTANPNVYLEVGYAWGCGVPCILLARSQSDLKFDVRGHRCLIYIKIKDLEANLSKELEGLLAEKPR